MYAQDLTNRAPRQLSEVVNHFDAIAPVYYDIVDAYGTGLSYYHRKEIETTLEWVSKSDSQRILDAGCGPGRLTLALLSDRRSVVSLDLSKNMLHTLRHRASGLAGAELRAIRGIVGALPFASGSFDLVVCNEVLEHLPRFPADAEFMIAEISRVLRPNGHAILEFPLVAHSLLRRLPNSTVPWSSFARAEWEQVPRPPLRFQRRLWRHSIERMMRNRGLWVVSQRFARVIPSGYIRGNERLAKLDILLERIPIARSLAREVILLARKIERDG